jgi:hypothetical protein
MPHFRVTYSNGISFYFVEPSICKTDETGGIHFLPLSWIALVISHRPEIIEPLEEEVHYNFEHNKAGPVDLLGRGGDVFEWDGKTTETIRVIDSDPPEWYPSSIWKGQYYTCSSDAVYRGPNTYCLE